MFLIESIGWTDAQPHVMALPAATQARNTPASKDNAAVARVWPERPISLAAAKPLEVARVGYQPKGYVVDFVIIPETGIRPPSSIGDPTLHKAAQAVWIYYVDFNTTIQNPRIRWAQKEGHPV